MNLSALKTFAPEVRRQLIEAVGRKLDYVLTADTADLRAMQSQRKSLRDQAVVDRKGLIERVAYTWFNRLAALRFLDVVGRHPFHARVITPATDEETQPELLKLMRTGSLPSELETYTDVVRLNDLLDGRLPTATAGADPQGEVYRHLILATCRFYHAAMPFVFEKIDDETELLLPDDLLTPTSVVEGFRTRISDNDCLDVEVIGWLYQFYISEKKDEVFEGLKKNKKITPENIPAATQLFTPNWIVRYLVENSLGRLWMLNRPNSQLVDQMDYYIRPEQPEAEFLRIATPEDIKICDPACGSGHMLVYAFDVLYAIYEEEGYEPSGIPEKILTHNLYGVEIDERAGSLAAFALTMKARTKQRRFFRNPVQPNICVLKNVHFEDDELKEYMNFVGRELFTTSLITTLRQFEEADNFGSLISPVIDVAGILKNLRIKDLSENPILNLTHQKVLQALTQADYLSSRYYAVIANPPYMGSKGMNGRLGAWAKINYPSSKADLFAMFIERNLELVQKHGVVAMITMQSWMFLSSFEKLRAQILEEDTIISMAHLGARAFDSIGGEVVSTTAFVCQNGYNSEFIGVYLRLVKGNSESEKERTIRQCIKNPDCGWFYRTSVLDFKKIPGKPIAYWLSKKVINAFDLPKIGQRFPVKSGLTSGDKPRYVRNWSECDLGAINFHAINGGANALKWFPHNDGGPLRKWYGNRSSVIDWESGGHKIKSFKKSTVRSPQHYFKSGITWTDISTTFFAARYLPSGSVFENTGSLVVTKDDDASQVLGFLCSSVAKIFMDLMNPTLHYGVGEVSRLPFVKLASNNHVKAIVGHCITLCRSDWDSYETSWDFTSLSLLQPEYFQRTLKATYLKLRTHWQDMTLEMQQLEEENNRIFIEAYSLQEELAANVPLKEITLTCNPYYRYGGNKTETELEALLQSDTVKEFISYAVGCMFGRYALEKPGLILANRGESLEDYLKQVPSTSFQVDDDAIIPVLDGEWFEDDAIARVREFLSVTFGDNTLEENFRWLEEALGKPLRKYFTATTGGFYDHHLKTYKKRPIYWLFQSPKKHFRALVYMHRYTRDTVNLVLDDYLREFMHKLRSRLEHLEHVVAGESAAASDMTKARKEIDQIRQALRDCENYEREILLPLAQQRIEIDLDDGVKINYLKLGSALAAIPGLKAK